MDILNTIPKIGEALKIHIAKGEISDKKIDEMYKVLITGNGRPSVCETVRQHDDYIEDQKVETKDRAKRNFETGRAFAILLAGQILTLIIGALAVYFKK